MLNVHFYVRPWERRVVEIMTSGSTSDEVLGATASLLRRCELQVFTLRTVSIGLLYNRIWAAIKREALAIVDEGVATPAEVDDIVRQLDPAPARGPFERMDDVGLDTVRDIEGVYSARFGWARSALLRKLVESGRTGRKSGAGFFRYPTQH
jgi:3-hydroxybutyryl-CoA dehydrogenase